MYVVILLLELIQIFSFETLPYRTFTDRMQNGTSAWQRSNTVTQLTAWFGQTESILHSKHPMHCVGFQCSASGSMRQAICSCASNIIILPTPAICVRNYIMQIKLDVSEQSNVQTSMFAFTFGFRSQQLAAIRIELLCGVIHWPPEVLHQKSAYAVRSSPNGSIRSTTIQYERRMRRSSRWRN